MLNNVFLFVQRYDDSTNSFLTKFHLPILPLAVVFYSLLIDW